MVLDELKDTSYELFTDFKANPTVTNVKDGVKAFKEAKADLVIAIWKKAASTPRKKSTAISLARWVSIPPVCRLMKRLMPRSKR